MNFRFAFTFGLAGVIALGAGVSAQDSDRIRIRVRDRAIERTVTRNVVVQQSSVSDPCRDSGRDDDYYRHCEVREETMPAGPLTVDAGTNGGISVEGWDNNQIRVRAVVTANARREEDAKQLASAVQVQIGGGRVSSSGPSTNGREWWSVSYRISVPRRNDLELNANNGGITVSGVSSTVRFETRNGGVRLSAMGGDVKGETHNGGLTVVLDGSHWDGTGLDVQTTNGGVTLSVPEGYNAELTTRTLNGGFSTDLPITIQGELTPRQGLTTTLGSGGAPVSVRTTNGGLRITRR